MSTITASNPVFKSATVACPATDFPVPTSGADIVVQSLVNHGVDTVFAYPGGASIPAAPGVHAISRSPARHIATP